MKRLLHSVRLRLTLWYAGVLAVALAVFAVAVYVFVVRTLQTNIDQALQTYGQQVNQETLLHSHGQRFDVNKVPVRPLSYREPTALLIMNIRNQVRTVKHGNARPAYQPLQIALRTGTTSCKTIHAAGRSNSQISALRYCIKLVYRNHKPVGGVEVVESLVGVDKTLERLRLALILGIPFALLLAGGGGWILAGRALEPVDDITGLARSITATDLSRRIHLNRQDELGRLAGTFDEMIDRLERAFQEQRQLTADVSHELRSPLTVLEAQTTLALRRSRTPDEYRQVLTSVQEEVERMSSMVNQLLMLARADAGEEVVNLQTVSLSSVADPVVDGMQALAAERGVRLRLISEGDIWVHGDPARLRQLLVNLLANALQHTFAGGRVDVVMAQKGDKAILSVVDNGEGVAPEDLPHIFQRFYRGDRARRRGTGNSGLGLAIVKWIVEAHGGDIRVQSVLDQGTRFDVALPLVSAPVSDLQPVS